jgi:hypothetical protein
MGDFLLVEVREIAVEAQEQATARATALGTVVVEKQISPLRSSR